MHSIMHSQTILMPCNSSKTETTHNTRARNRLGAKLHCSISGIFALLCSLPFLFCRCCFLCRYFASIIERMGEDDRVVICCHEVSASLCLLLRCVLAAAVAVIDFTACSFASLSLSLSLLLSHFFFISSSCCCPSARLDHRYARPACEW